jgi:hypothetical protein
MHTHAQHGGLTKNEHEMKISCKIKEIVHITKTQLNKYILVINSINSYQETINMHTQVQWKINKFNHER